MQEQYQKIKAEHQDSVVLFRLGDFYEAFFEDAELLSRVLGITLTGRGKDEARYAMAGIPYHALPNYLPKLVAENIKVVIADQVEEATPGKLVDRKITKIITPGTITDENSLDSSKNNYVASLYMTTIHQKQVYNVAFSDLTTGEFKVFHTNSALVLKNEINKIHPSEVLVLESQKQDALALSPGFITTIPDKILKTNLNELLCQTLAVQSLKAFGIYEDDDIIVPAGLIIWYLKESQRSELKHIKTIERFQYSDFMQLDPETIRNLELVNSASGDPRISLYGILNETATPMGKRLLRSTILRPFLNQDMIQDRLDAVDFFVKESMLREQIREMLAGIYDIERLSGKIGYGSVNPRDLFSLAESMQIGLDACRVIHQHTQTLTRRLEYLVGRLNYEEIQKIIELITNTIHPDAPVTTNEGGIFVDGYHAEVDEFRSIQKNIKQILTELQQREIQSTGISSLKIAYNSVFGYYIEITNSHKDKVPESYIRKQTLSNAERYITQELKELEEKILTSEDRLIKLEQKLFIAFKAQLSDHIQLMQSLCKVMSEIDIITSFAHTAKKNRYVKPEINPSEETKIEHGRHPVVEKLVQNFVANTTTFENSQLVHILTGPNMSGKSTYIRQVALLVLLAHMGSFVPADRMTFALCDRVFTRVGAGDNLAKGESTFMVEMIETANILHNATKKSLIILDEVGRGTSTYDGVAIAWSIVEYITNHIKANTLFATHYHELTALGNQKGIKNYTVQVLEKDGEIYFQHKIIDGSASRSYGVHVAKLAGVPVEVVTRADEILANFEGEKGEITGQKLKDKSKKPTAQSSKLTAPPRPSKIHPEQMSLI